MQLAQQLTRNEMATHEAFQQLKVFQQHCDNAGRQNEALLAELQRLQQQKQQQHSRTNSMPASTQRYMRHSHRVASAWALHRTMFCAHDGVLARNDHWQASSLLHMGQSHVTCHEVQESGKPAPPPFYQLMPFHVRLQSGLLLQVCESQCICFEPLLHTCSAAVASCAFA